MNTTIAVIGLGYVGLPLALEFAKKGVRTYGFDISQRVIDNIKNVEGVTFDIKLEELREVLDSGIFTIGTDGSVIGNADIAIICVPTPLDKSKQPDLGAVVSASNLIASQLKKGQLVVMESTTYPGTTNEVIRPILEKNGLKAGTDFNLAFSPERIDPGNKTYQVHNTPKIVGGHTQACTDRAKAIYEIFLPNVHPVSSTQAAEMVKILENTFRVVNIALVDELTILCDRMGIDIWEVIDAAKTKPYGFMPFYPGPGVGGHCIPIDPFYLSWKAKEFDFNTRFIEMAGEMSDSMPYFTVDKLMKIMNKRGVLMNGSNILVLGLAYKKDIADWRESPSFKVISLLEKNGAKVTVSDPYISKVDEHGVVVATVPLTDALLQSADATIIITDHSDYEADMIVKNSKIVFDTRNLIKSRKHNNVYHL